jgi:hypothetical protein
MNQLSALTGLPFHMKIKATHTGLEQRVIARGAKLIPFGTLGFLGGLAVGFSIRSFRYRGLGRSVGYRGLGRSVGCLGRSIGYGWGLGRSTSSSIESVAFLNYNGTGIFWIKHGNWTKV